MRAVDGVRPFENALFDGPLRAHGDLLAGLEEQADGAVEPIPMLGENTGGAELHGDVAVVAAGVHPSVMRGEGQPRRLVPEQRVNVRAEDQRLPRVRAPNFASQPVIFLEEIRLQSHRAEVRRDRLCRLNFLPGKFRDSVIKAPAFNDVGLQPLRKFANIHSFFSQSFHFTSKI